MKTAFIRGLTVASLLLAPAGMVLAKGGGELGVSVQGDAQVGTAIHTTLQGNTEVHEEHGGANMKDSDARGTTGATSTRHGGHWSNSDNSEDIRGAGHEEHNDKTVSSTTKNKEHGDRDDNHVRGENRGLASFFSWFFGLPASTTVGDIRAQINASTTVAGNGGHDNEGLGFFARLFSMFNFGGKSDE